MIKWLLIASILGVFIVGGYFLVNYEPTTEVITVPAETSQE
jgi:hypothetical protein